MALSIFTPSCTGMSAQSQALETVSTNIANIRTTGYKVSETMFYTLLGSQPIVKGNQSGLSSSHTDIDGVGYYNRNLIDMQGVVTSTGGNYDVAINGTGNAFFMVKDGEDVYYTRAGDFETRTVDGKTYLITSGGLRVQGFPALEGGGFGSNPEDIEIISPETIPPTPTSEMSITANVPADETSSSYALTIYGEQYDGRTMNMKFDKVEGQNNIWDVSFVIEDGTVTTSEPVEVLFDANGQLVSPKNIDINIAWEDGTSQTVNIDISNMTQYTGSNELTNVTQDGMQSGRFSKSWIDENGVVQAVYSNGKSSNVMGTTFNNAKLALVGFSAPNNLYPVSGTLFEAYPDAGESTYLETSGLIQSQALESSTANVEEEFSTMMIVQRAYSLNATAFTTSDEMLQELVNLKT